MSHVKLEKARIVGNILNSYNNKSQLVPEIVSHEDFEKSLGEGEVFYEGKIIQKFLQDVEKSQDVEQIEKAKKDVSKLKKKQVLDKEGNVKDIFVKSKDNEEEE